MSDTATSRNSAPPHPAVGHVVPLPVLAAVWAGLMVLTVATVAVTRLDLGWFNVWLALLIATAKAALVALYFMHLRYDSPFNAIVLVAALLFVTIFISIALMDTAAYQESFEVPPNVRVAPS